MGRARNGHHAQQTDAFARLRLPPRGNAQQARLDAAVATQDYRALTRLAQDDNRRLAADAATVLQELLTQRNPLDVMDLTDAVGAFNGRDPGLRASIEGALRRWVRGGDRSDPANMQLLSMFAGKNELYPRATQELFEEWSPESLQYWLAHSPAHPGVVATVSQLGSAQIFDRAQAILPGSALAAYRDVIAANVSDITGRARAWELLTWVEELDETTVNALAQQPLTPSTAEAERNYRRIGPLVYNMLKRRRDLNDPVVQTVKLAAVHESALLMAADVMMTFDDLETQTQTLIELEAHNLHGQGTIALRNEIAQFEGVQYAEAFNLLLCGDIGFDVPPGVDDENVRRAQEELMETAQRTFSGLLMNGDTQPRASTYRQLRPVLLRSLAQQAATSNLDSCERYLGPEAVLGVARELHCDQKDFGRVLTSADWERLFDDDLATYMNPKAQTSATLHIQVGRGHQDRVDRFTQVARSALNRP